MSYCRLATVGCNSDTLLVLVVGFSQHSVQLGIAETPVNIRSLERNAVFGEGQALYDIAPAPIFELRFYSLLG